MLKICKSRLLGNQSSIQFFTSSVKSTQIFSTMGAVEESIKGKLTDNFNPCHLEIINESFMHNVPKGSETHFKVVVVSEKFKDLPLVKRHRLINNVLKNELQNNVHALSIIAKTPDQWENSDKIIEHSPNCKGGFGK